MNNVLGKALIAIGSVLFLAVFALGFLAYFVTSHQSGLWVDGLGRELSETPIFVRFLLGQERLWAGWIWWAADMVWFFGGLGAAFATIAFGSDFAKSESK